MVHAKNFASSQQKYSLAITGCFRTSSTTANSSASNQSSQQQQQQNQQLSSMVSSSSVAKSSCPSNRLFKVELNTANDGQKLSWNLIKSLDNGGVKQLKNGPTTSSGYQNYKRYTATACLETSTRYRFQLRNTSGGSIKSRYKLTYKDQVVFNSQWSSQNALGRVSTFRFKTNQYGKYIKLGSNEFSTHVQFSDTAEIGVEGTTPSPLPYSYESSESDVISEAIYDDETDEGEGVEEVGEVVEAIVPQEYDEFIDDGGEGAEEVGDVKEAIEPQIYVGFEDDGEGKLAVASLEYLLDEEEEATIEEETEPIDQQGDKINEMEREYLEETGESI